MILSAPIGFWLFALALISSPALKLHKLRHGRKTGGSWLFHNSGDH
jgi:hypothetical protein